MPDGREPATPDPDERPYGIARSMEEIRTERNGAAIDLIRVLLVEGAMDRDVAEELIAEPDELTPEQVSAALQASERAAAQDAPVGEAGLADTVDRFTQQGLLHAGEPGVGDGAKDTPAQPGKSRHGLTR